jgi:hypothetical protein
MSVAELKKAVDELSTEERLELSHYLRHRTKLDDPHWAEELRQRIDRSTAGEGHSANELLALHERLSREGR